MSEKIRMSVDELERAAAKELTKLLQQYKIADIEEKLAADRKSELKDKIAEIAMDSGAEAIDSEIGSVTIREPSERKTLQPKKVVTLLGRHGIPMSELEECYSISKIDAGIMIRLAKDE